MDFKWWVGNALQKARSDGVIAGIREATLSAGRFYYQLFPEPPRHILNSTWDLCIVLDACRADTFREIGSNHPALNEAEFGTAWSIAAATRTWMERTFTDSYANRLSTLGYVVSNGYSQELDEGLFGHLEHVWEYGFDETVNTVPPRPVTDAGIQLGRKADLDQVIVHYLQPHFPPLDRSLPIKYSSPSVNKTERTVWEAIKDGDITQNTAKDAYEENLTSVLDDVGLLLDNFDAGRVLITADHGNGFGEWGVYGHPDGTNIPAVREVPWTWTSATDAETHAPAIHDTSSSETKVEQQLRALGYR